MNRTESVSIGRRGFVCEQDAYKVLQDYLIRSAKILQDDPDNDEIIADLEVSMAGHLSELTGELVIDRATAIKVVEQMGEVFAEHPGDDEQKSNDTNTSREEVPFSERLRGIFKKPLYKDHEHQIADGVCAGIANALAVDPIWVRIAFVILTFITQGFMIVVYFILDFIMRDEESYTKRTAGEVIKDAREKIASTVDSRRYESTLRRLVIGAFTIVWWIFKITALLVIASVIVSIGVAWAYSLFAMFAQSQIVIDLIGTVTWLKTIAVCLAGIVLLLPLVHLLALLIAPRKVMSNTRLAVLIWVTWFVALFGGVGAIGNTLPEIVSRWKENPPHTRYVNVRIADGNIEDVCADVMGGCLDPKHYITGYGSSPCSTTYRTFYKGEADYWIGKMYTSKSYIKVPYPGTRESFCEQAVSLIKRYGEQNIAFSDDYENEDVVSVSEEQNGITTEKKYWQVEYVYSESAQPSTTK